LHLDSERLSTVAAAFRAGASSYRSLGSPLYGAICEAGASDEDIIALASHAQSGAQPAFHLMAAAHYLLLGDPSDPLGRHYATLTDDPLAPEQAYPEFARFCREHRAEILELLQTRSVQTTYVERCAPLMAPLSIVAGEAGEPLNLIEIGCSAALLLTFDEYRYELSEGGTVGPAEAPLTLKADIRGAPPLRIPRIGTRFGLDLNPIDARLEDERRWLIALTFPEYKVERARLSKGLEVVAQSDLHLLKGDALDLLPALLAGTPSPLCVFHSACLFYWSEDGKAALESMLIEASCGRTIFRVGIEPARSFDSWRKGLGGDTKPATRQGGEVMIVRYRNGTANAAVVGSTTVGGPLIFDGAELERFLACVH